MAPGGCKPCASGTSAGAKLGLDIDKVKGTGSAGMVTEQEQAFEAQQESGNEFLKGSRRAMAKAMELSHRTVVPVSITDEVDLRHWRRMKM
jgi:pyruvate dehydrogenase E2 component (dihydrolipoamide acetyltransferase)